MSFIHNGIEMPQLDNSTRKNGRKILLSTVGTRGDVQPLAALGIELRRRGHRPVLCVGPNFKAWVESFELEYSSYGIDLTTMPELTSKIKTHDEGNQFITELTRSSFRDLENVAAGSDLILVAGAHQYSGRSIAESLGIPYVCAAYCPSMLPSLSHPPAQFGDSYHNSQVRPKSVNKSLWEAYEKKQNDTFSNIINSWRNEHGLGPIKNVHRHIITEQPWLAVDKVLGPAAKSKGLNVTQTGPWLLKADEPLPRYVEEFLERGDKPIYLGFGSMDNGYLDGEAVVKACRLSGRRAIIYRGWAKLDIESDGVNIISVEDINHSKLFPRVAAVVHHGGVGTLTAAAIAGVPQVIVPHFYDQFYWAHCVKKLGIGIACRSSKTLNIDSLAGVMRDILQEDRISRAQCVSREIELHGTEITADLIESAMG